MINPQKDERTFMKRVFILFALLLLLTGCGTKESAQPKAEEKEELAETCKEADDKDDILNLVIMGKMPVTVKRQEGEEGSFLITDLPMDAEEDWESYSIGDREITTAEYEALRKEIFGY